MWGGMCCRLGGHCLLMMNFMSCWLTLGSVSNALSLVSSACACVSTLITCWLSPAAEPGPLFHIQPSLRHLVCRSVQRNIAAASARVLVHCSLCFLLTTMVVLGDAALVAGLHIAAQMPLSVSFGIAVGANMVLVVLLLATLLLVRCFNNATGRPAPDALLNGPQVRGHDVTRCCSQITPGGPTGADYVILPIGRFKMPTKYPCRLVCVCQQCAAWHQSLLWFALVRHVQPGKHPLHALVRYQAYHLPSSACHNRSGKQFPAQLAPPWSNWLGCRVSWLLCRLSSWTPSWPTSLPQLPC